MFPSTLLLCRLRPLKIVHPMRPSQRHIKVAVNSIRQGHVIEVKGKPCVVTKATHTVSGRGSASVKFELSSIADGSKVLERFGSSDAVEKLEVQYAKTKYLYHTDDSVTLVDDTNDEITIPGTCMQGFPHLAPLLDDTTSILLATLHDRPVNARLETKTLRVVIDTTEVTPKLVMNASTKSVAFKPAYVHGVRVDVPEFVATGDAVEVMVDEQSKLTYLRRAK